MRLLVDENLPRLAVDGLRELGHEVTYIPDTEFRSEPDQTLVSLCNDEGRLLLTRDLDILQDAPGLETGLILVRVSDDAVAAPIADLIVTNFSKLQEDQLAGRITVIEPGRMRQRELSGT